MKKITLDDGFEFEVDENLIDDWNFIKLLDEAKSNPLAFHMLWKYVLGDKSDAYEVHLATLKQGKLSFKDDILPSFTKVIETITEQLKK